MCAVPLGARDLALRLANKRTTSLPEDSDTEYGERIVIVKDVSTPYANPEMGPTHFDEIRNNC